MSAVPFVVTVAVSGSPNRYLSTGGFVSKTTDTPASTAFLPLVRDTISYGIEPTCWMWGGQGARGEATDVSLGTIDLDNTGGALDSWLAEQWRDRTIEIRRGKVTSAYDDLALVTFAVVDRAEMVDQHTFRLTLKHKGALLEVSAQQTMYGTIANAPSLEGTPRPICIGNCEGVPLTLVNDALLDYDLHDAAPLSIDEVTDQGTILTHGTRWEESPAVGVFGVRRLDSPAGKQVAKVQGAADGSTLIERLPDVIAYLLGRSESAISPADVGPYTVDDLDTAAPYKLCRWWRDDSTIGQVLSEVLDSFGGWWFFDRLGLLQVGRLEVAAGDPVLEISTLNLDGGAEGIVPYLDTASGLSDSIGGVRNWSPHRDGEIDGDVVTNYPARAQRIAGEQQVRTGVGTLHDSYRHAIGAPAKKTLLSDATDVQTEATRIVGTYEEEKYFYPCTVLLGETEADLAFTIQPGDSATLTLPRFGLDAGKLMLVVAVRARLVSNRVDLVLWGEGPQPGDF